MTEAHATTIPFPRQRDGGVLVPVDVDAAVDAVGFEARGHGQDAQTEKPATVLNSIMDVTRVAGKLGIPGLYVTGDPGGVDEAAKQAAALDPAGQPLAARPVVAPPAAPRASFTLPSGP